MEIIHLILGKANPNRMNGVNKVVHELATTQVEKGIRAEVWGITDNPVHDYPSRIFKTKLFKSSRNPFGFDKYLKSALIAKKQTAVIHIHGAFLPVFYSASAFLAKNNIPFIITPHSSYNIVMMKKNSLIKKIYFSLFEKKLLDRSSFIHLVGKSELAGLNVIYHNRKSALIPYGFNIPVIKKQAKKSTDIVVFGYCGRFDIHSKGLDIMLEGFALLHKQFANTKLMVIGDGDQRPKVEAIIKQLGIEDAVELMGSRFGDEKVALLQQCHVFVHPSRSDGLPATIVEAAALGLPSVVSEETNIGDFVTAFDAGHSMKSLNATEFYQGLSSIYKRIYFNNELEQLKKNALQMIEEAFDWNTVLAKLNKLYKEAYFTKHAMLQQENVTAE